MLQQDDDPVFENLIRYIQESRGVDFRGYKRSSLRRRITLRMEQVGADSFAAYHAFIEADPTEVSNLLNTVLINLTALFRDPDAWDVLNTTILPGLIDPARGRDQLRAWSIGCASGEEPYSLAMLLCELLGPAEFADRVKIYATDLDDAALNAARRAQYSPRDVENVPEAFRDKYFERTNDHYVVARDLRKAVIFGRHNIVHDAPISRVDLLVCRNLLIYLETETQKRVLPRLHYALVDDGVLFLGKAETQLAGSTFFQPIDTKQRLFRKVPHAWRRLGNGGTVLNREVLRDAEPALPRRLLDTIVDSAAAAFLAIDHDDILIFASAGARRLLDVGDSDVGRPFQDLSISYRPADLRSQIDAVRQQGRPTRIEHQEYRRLPAAPLRLTIDTAPMPGRDPGLTDILFTFSDTTRTFNLQRELEAAQESLETTIEELQSANEELETTNEELQSANEELETINEELQSTNAELQTTNDELRTTNDAVEQMNLELHRRSDEFSDYRRYTDAILLGVDAGLVVVDAALRVISWNRWSENTWGVRAEEVLGQVLLFLDVGLPVKQFEAELRAAAVEGVAGETTVTALDRRARTIACRVRVWPVLRTDRTTQGAIIMVDNVTLGRGSGTEG